MEKTDQRYRHFVQILREELVPAMGCTEPIAIAYGAAKAREILGRLPDQILVEASGNIIKNVKSAVVPNTGGLKGIEASAAAGVVAGEPDRILQVISHVPAQLHPDIAAYAQEAPIEIVCSDTPRLLDIRLTGWQGDHSALIHIANSHSNIVREEKDGTALRVAACCIDSGYRSNQVYSFTVDKFDRHVFAIKGKGGQGVPYIRNPSKDNRVKTPLFTIGVDAGKDFIHQRLRVVMKGSNYCHFPLDEGTGYDETYFKGLASEMKITRFQKGKMTVAWVLRDKNYKRNEPLDLRNYATAALEIYNPPLQKPEQGAEQRPRRLGRRVLSGGI